MRRADAKNANDLFSAKPLVPTVLALLVLSLLFSACRSSEPVRPGKGRPAGMLNVVFVLSDALRAANLQRYGYKRKTAPQLELIAQRGIVFEQHFSHSSFTPQSISQMFTGRLMPPLLMSAHFRLAAIRGIADDLFILPEVLRKAGYSTGIASSHPWFDKGSRILNYFDWKRIVEPQKKKERRPYAPFGDLVPHILEFIDESAGKANPFFIYVHSMDTHAPFHFESGFKEFKDKTSWRTEYNAYDAEIQYTDFQVGRIFDYLERKDLAKNTIFVFTSDHGEEFNEMGPGETNRNHGYTARRALVHVPLIIVLPQDPSPGRRFKSITRHLDLAPTLAHLATGKREFGAYRIEGRDLAEEIYKGSTKSFEKAEVISVGPRFWGLHSERFEAYYDQWLDMTSTHRIEPDSYNYPRPVPAGPTKELGLSARLSDVYSMYQSEYDRLPAAYDLLGKAEIGIPTEVVRNGGSSPVFDSSEKDNKWLLVPWIHLICGKDEHPGPITLRTPWVAGEFRVWVKLDMEWVKKGYKNGFRVEFNGNKQSAVSFAPAGTERGAVLDAGVQKLSNPLEIAIDEMQGGVALTGFILEYLGKGAKDVSPNQDLIDRLKALGYVE